MTPPREVEPTLAAMQAAAEHARAANHHAYQAPRTPASIYDRTGALHDLLGKTEQLAQVLAEHAQMLVVATPPGLYSDDDSSPTVHAATASAWLRRATSAVRDANDHVNLAWSSLSHLGLRDTDGAA